MGAHLRGCSILKFDSYSYSRYLTTFGFMLMPIFRKQIKKEVGIALLLICQMVSFGQGYSPMLGDSITWFIYNNFEGCFTTTYMTFGDTLISGIKYEILTGSNCYTTANPPPCPIAFLKEDTQQQKVFVRVSSEGVGIPDTTERVFYDFSLQQGDSIFLTNPNFNSDWWYHIPSVDTLGWYDVDTVYMVSTLVGTRKLIHLKNRQVIQLRDMTWVEGIGAVEGIYLYGGGETWLSCGFRNNIREWAHFPNDTNCVCNSVGIIGVYGRDEISISPNPATTNLNIHVEGRDLEIVSIYNLSGQVVFNVTHPSLETFNIENLDVGFYLVELTLDSKQSRGTNEKSYGRFFKF